MDRSENMRRIRSKDTAPEMAVRRLIHGLGFRYRLHVKDMPGKPDLVFPSRRKIIFVHGCFWHQHRSCREGRLPKSNRSYWTPKLQRNVKRDRQALRQLHSAGWDTLVIWECQASDLPRLQRMVLTFLGQRRSGASKLR